MKQSIRKVLWIARDSNGDLYAYEQVPYLKDETFYPAFDGWACQIDSDLYPELTFENSPKQLFFI